MSSREGLKGILSQDESREKLILEQTAQPVFNIGPDYKMTDFDIEPEPGAQVQEESVNFLKAEEVASASSIEDLLNKVASVEKIQGVEAEGEYDASYVIKKITDFKDFLNSNMEALQASVIVEDKGKLNEELMNKLSKIPTGLGLRQKAKDLMEQKWNSYFSENKNKLAYKMVAEAPTVKSLCFILAKIKTVTDTSGLKKYGMIQTVDKIKDAEQILKAKVETGAWREVNTDEIAAEIKSALSPDEIPGEYGIYDKASILLHKEVSQAIKDKKLADFSSGSNGSIAGKKGGWLRKIGSWLGW